MLFVVATTLLAVGCIMDRDSPKKLALGVDAMAGDLSRSAAFRDTIGSLTTFEGLRTMRVRGYSLVVGLGNLGSRDCPRNVYERLVTRMYKLRDAGGSIVSEKKRSPESMIDDIGTAVVVVEGEIPPGAMKGTRLDVTVKALPGTQTKSLRGGRLYATELEIYRKVSPTVALPGKTLAYAGGPVLLNPFSDSGAPTPSRRLEGVVIGGGLLQEDRRLRLVLNEASYQVARQIEHCVNAHFPAKRKVADAISPSLVKIHVPREFHDDTGHFLGLVRALFLSRDPGFQGARARALADEILSPTAPHALISTAFEALGRDALPVLETLYGHPKDYVGFFAAVSGLRLGDHLATDAMKGHAEDSTCKYRLRAIEALASAHGSAIAARCLRKLLDDSDARVRVAAYEGLAARNDPVVQSAAIGADNFVLDRVPSTAPSIVYLKRSGERRIALIGDNLRCLPPVFYRSPDGSVTITAQADDETLTLLRRVVTSGAVSPPIDSSFDLPSLIHLLGSEAIVTPAGKVLGLGLDYGTVMSALHHFGTDKNIAATVMLEQSDLSDLLGLPRPAGRPESELVSR